MQLDVSCRLTPQGAQELGEPFRDVPMRGLGLCTQTWLSLDAAAWGGWWDFAWSSSFRPRTIPGEELGEGSAQHTGYLGTEADWVVPRVISKGSLFSCSQQWNMVKEMDKDTQGQLEDFC